MLIAVAKCIVERRLIEEIAVCDLRSRKAPFDAAGIAGKTAYSMPGFKKRWDQTAADIARGSGNENGHGFFFPTLRRDDTGTSCCWSATASLVPAAIPLLVRVVAHGVPVRLHPLDVPHGAWHAGKLGGRFPL
jgi:hypothetical protein